MTTHKNRVQCAISNTPGSSGDLTLSTAASGFRTLGASDDGLSFDVVIVDGTAWEVRTDCTYTHSGTSLARGTLEDSSTGSAITLTSAAVVTVTATAGWGNLLDRVLFDGFSAYGDGSTTVTLTNGATTLVSTAAKTEVFDAKGEFDPSTGIYFPSRAGLYLIGGTAIHASASDGATTAIYVEHSTDGSTWSGTAKRALLWRGVSGATAVSVGGSGAYVVDVNGTTDRFRMSVFYTGTGTNTVPGSAANRDWIRFWSKYLGETS